MKKFYFVTSNKGKVIEAKKKLLEIGIDVTQKNLGYPEIQTDNLEEVVEFGIKHLKEKTDIPFILEDAGLFIESLNGFPGVYSAYIYYTLGCNGILKLLEKEKNRKAVFKSVYGFYDKETKKIFVGKCQGKINNRITGENGFGYDPIFIPNKKNKTFAQMIPEEKNTVSHRGRALDKLTNFLKKY